MRPSAFLDTAYAIALSVANDRHHGRALNLADQLESVSTRLLTTRPVMLENGDALSKQGRRVAAVELLNSLESDPNVEIIPLSEDLYQQAVQICQQRPDKEWGLTDCVSFVVMEARGITEALTTDEHFQQAGFRALLR
ncbi:MAG: type II toxin-antitoxin system VapC family toxin [Chloroflexi bacterium]|nr:type II toxin-antitoxin system VapC family toxin [Chloroflexota bacterium]